MSHPTMKCPTCEGLGEWDEGPVNTGGPAPVDPEYRQVTCPDCKGHGRIGALQEPTDLMIHAGRCAIAEHPDDDYEQARACWKAMLVEQENDRAAPQS